MLSALSRAFGPFRLSTVDALRKAHEHVVNEGRVRCGKVGHDVSVEECWMCDRLEGFVVTGEREIVRCTPQPAARGPVPATV